MKVAGLVESGAKNIELSVPRSRFLLVDGHAYAYRAFYAIRGMKSPRGEPTNAIYGFVKMLGRMRGWLNPTHIGVIWDGGLDAERLRDLPGYKAERPEMPSELREQIDNLMEWVSLAGMVSVCQAGIEADDLIGSLAVRSEKSGLEALIASSDKDFMQLVRAGLGLINPNDKSERIWTADDVMAKLGVLPAQVVDYLSLVGDAVDGIPGVPGVGPKTAASLLNRFQTVAGIYAGLGEIEPLRIRELLAASEEAVRRNQKLIALRLDLNGLPEPSEFKLGKPRWVDLTALYERWGFRSLHAEAQSLVGGGNALQADLL